MTEERRTASPGSRMSTSTAPRGWSTSATRRSPLGSRSPPVGCWSRRAVIELLRGDGVPKGDALGVARVAGILAAKRTPDLVPLCHPLPISGVEVDLELSPDAVEIRARVRTTGRTGVEMEALTSVAVAGLTLHDMVKAVDPAAVLTDVRVLSKSGGRSGDWERGESAAQCAATRRRFLRSASVTSPGSAPGLPSGALARVVTVSDRVARRGAS